MYRILIFYVIICVSISNAQIPGIGSCPRVELMYNFNLSPFLGRWYISCSYPDKMALDARCAETTFSWGANNVDGISVFSSHVSFGKEKKFMGSARIIHEGVLGITFPTAPKSNAFYNILDTDYTNYAVIYACTDYLGFVNSQNLWIVSRRRYLEPQYVEKAIYVINRNRLSTFFLRHIDQSCENSNSYQNQNSYYGKR